MSNKKVEEKAIKLVLKHLKKRGERVKNCGYDIKTRNKKIEVKARSYRNKVIELNYSNVNAFKKNKNIELWIVVKVKTRKPELIKIKKSELLERKKAKEMWRFSLKESDYAKSIGL